MLILIFPSKIWAKSARYTQQNTVTLKKPPMRQVLSRAVLAFLRIMKWLLQDAADATWRGHPVGVGVILQGVLHSETYRHFM